MARKSRKNLDTAAVETTNAATVCNAGGYVRLSVTDNHKKGDSIESQKAILLNFISLTPGIKLHDFYIDNGVSGTTFERKAFQKMLEDAERGVINCIVVKDLSRLGRSAIDTGYYIEKYLPSINCRFIAVNDDFDTNNADNGAGVLLPLKNVINEAYALDIGRKIKSQQQQAMKSGEYIGARPPYGYLKAPGNCHKLVVDPATAPIVRNIFEMFLGGLSVNEIVLRMNEAKIATPSHYRKELGIIKHENLIGKGAWQTFTITRILTGEVYVGDMVQGKSKSLRRKQTAVAESEWIRVPDTHEPIISREAFEQAQTRLKYLADKAAAKTKTPYTQNIFKGKVFCGHCGGSMHRHKQLRKKTQDSYVFYCLSNSRKARGSCISFIMPEEDLKITLLAAVQSHADAIIGKSLKLRENTAELSEQRKAANSEIAALRQEANNSGRMFKSLYENLVNGLITTDEYREMRETYETKARECLAHASELETRQAEFEKQTAEYCELSDLLSDTVNNGITAKVIDCLVDRIRIFSDRSIEVDFKFDGGFGLIDGGTDNE